MGKKRFDFIISVLPKTSGVCEQIDEQHQISHIIADALNEHGYRFIMADEDMMSDGAKQIADNMNENTQHKYAVHIIHHVREVTLPYLFTVEAGNEEEAGNIALQRVQEMCKEFISKEFTIDEVYEIN